jgi:hypothetical protein
MEKLSGASLNAISHASMNENNDGSASNQALSWTSRLGDYDEHAWRVGTGRVAAVLLRERTLAFLHRVG